MEEAKYQAKILPNSEEFFFYQIPYFENNVKPSKVCFVYETDNEHSQYIESRLAENFQERNDITFSSASFQETIYQMDGLKNEFEKEAYKNISTENGLKLSKKQALKYQNHFEDIMKYWYKHDTDYYYRCVDDHFVFLNLLKDIFIFTFDHKIFNDNEDCILIVMMNSYEQFSQESFDKYLHGAYWCSCCGITWTRFNFYFYKIIFIDSGDKGLNKKIVFSNLLFENFLMKGDKEDHVSYLFEQIILPQHSIRMQHHFEQFVKIVAEKIVQTFSSNSRVTINQKLQQYPWSEPTDKVINGSIVVSKSLYVNKIRIASCDTKFVNRINNLDAEQMCGIFSLWGTEIHANKYEIPKQDIERIKEYIQNFQNSYNESIENALEDNEMEESNLSIKQKLIKNEQNKITFQLHIMIKSLTELTSINTTVEINDNMLLEREKIGTLVGKFHQRALKISGLDIGRFQESKEYFKQILKSVRNEINVETDEIRSIFSFETFKDVILQEDIFEALDLIKNQYSLISSFPLVGLGLKLQRSNGSMINPYLVKVIDIARINKYVDTVSIQNTEDKQLTLNSGYYKHQHGQKEYLTNLNEQIDAVLPLYGPKDYDLAPLLKSQFYHTLMTFNVMRNVDTVYDQAYLALLANSLIFLLNEDKSEFISDLLEKIYHSTQIVYGEKQYFKDYCQQLIANPRLAMVTYHEGLSTQCQAPSKPLLCLFYLIRKNTITRTENQALIKDILVSIMQEIVARGIKDTSKITSHFSNVGLDKQEIDKLVNITVSNYTKKVTDYPTIRAMMAEVEKDLKESPIFKNIHSCKLVLNKKKFDYLNFGKYNFFVCLKNICNYFLPGEKFQGELLWIWLYHILKHSSSNYERNTAPILTNMKKIYLYFKSSLIQKYLSKTLQKTLKKCESKLAPQFQVSMMRLHIRITPISSQEIKEKLKLNKDAQIKFNKVSNLTRSYCLCPDCPFYLKKLSNLSEHLKDSDCSIPGFSKTVKIMRNEYPDDILLAIKKGLHLSRDDAKSYIQAYRILKSSHVLSLFSIFEKELIDSIKETKALYLKLH